MKKILVVLMVFVLVLSAVPALAEINDIIVGFQGHIQDGVDLSVFNDNNYDCYFYDLQYRAEIITKPSATIRLKLFIEYDDGTDSLVFLPAVYIMPWEFKYDDFYLRVNGRRYLFDVPQQNNTFLSENALNIFRDMAALSDDFSTQAETANDGEVADGDIILRYSAFSSSSPSRGSSFGADEIQAFKQFFEDCDKAGIDMTYSTMSVEPVLITNFN